MQTKKLSEAQRLTLNCLSDGKPHDWYDLRVAGAFGPSVNKLTELGLARKEPPLRGLGGSVWTITEAGKKALLEGRYPAEPSITRTGSRA